MSEILRNEENEDFATLLEQSLESEKIYNGKRVTGVVTSVAPNEVHVDIGAKQAGIVPAEELTDDPNAKIEELVKKGDEIELSVVKVNDQEGIVTLSKKRCDAQKGFEKIKEAYENGTILDAVITDVDVYKRQQDCSLAILTDKFARNIHKICFRSKVFEIMHQAP